MINSAKEMMRFIARELAKQIKACQMTSLEYKGQLGHVYKQPNNIAVVCITTGDYPPAAAHGVIRNVLKEFNSKFKESDYTNLKDDQLKFPELTKLLQMFREPKPDKIEEIQKSIEDAKAIVQTSIEKVLNNMETLDKLVEKSNDLSDTSRMFYKKSKKMNRCCIIL